MEQKIKILDQEILAWANMATVSGYPGKFIRNITQSAANKVNFSIKKLPKYLALLPFYQNPEAEDYDRKRPFYYKVVDNLIIALGGLLLNKKVCQAVNEKITPIIIVCLSFYCFKCEIYKLYEEIKGKFGEEAWESFGIEDQLGNPCEPLREELRYCVPDLPKPSELAFLLGHLGNKEAIPILREARKFCCTEYEISEHEISPYFDFISEYGDPFLISLCKLNSQEELKELKNILSSGKVEESLILSLRVALLYHPDIVNLMKILSEQSSDIQENVTKFLDDYKDYTNDGN